jgi:hypothetical protein
MRPTWSSKPNLVDLSKRLLRRVVASRDRPRSAGAHLPSLSHHEVNLVTENNQKVPTWSRHKVNLVTENNQKVPTWSHHEVNLVTENAR